MQAYHKALLLSVFALAACGGNDVPPVREAAAAEPAAATYTVRDTTIEAVLEASGVAEPFAQATLSTKLMGTVTAVLVKEGDRVRAGDLLLRIDARDLDAKREQVRAGINSAEAMRHEAELGAVRMRALFADSAAPRAQLDAAEAALSRASAAVSAAQAGEAEVVAMASYSVVRAPFAGMITARMVDPGAFAAPGAPLLTLQDASRLRLTVAAPPGAVRGVRRGAQIRAAIEGAVASATVEGVVPTAGSMYAVNAIVPNGDGRFLAGSAATLMLNEGARHALLVPRSAVVREGDLTGVRVKDPTGSVLRWVRLGSEQGEMVEVIAGLEAGSVVLVQARRAGS